MNLNQHHLVILGNGKVLSMNRVKGSDIGLLNCPHCGKEVEFFVSGNVAYIFCSDRNCWSGTRCQWGTADEPYRFIEKMKNDWNKRTPDGNALVAAIEYIVEYRNYVYQEAQKEYSDYCYYCIDVLDEVINKLECFIK